MPEPICLNPEQKRFLAHACAFIDTQPPRHEIDKLLTLAAMLLPAPVARLLATRADRARSGGPAADEPDITGWLQ